MITNTSSLRIGTLDNAEHALLRGYDLVAEGVRKDSPYLIKEAIIWVHQGIELCLKQLLVQTNEFLVFENVDEAVRKLAHLRRQPNTEKAGVLDLFEQGVGVRTVGYKKLVDRVAVMLGISELAPGSHFRDNIDELTILRNKIVHFFAEVDLEKAAKLLADIALPFLELMQRHLKGAGLTYAVNMCVHRDSRTAAEGCRSRRSGLEQRVLGLLGAFRGQEVPGVLFGRDGSVKLPDFSNAAIRREADPIGMPTYLATSDTDVWLIVLVEGYANKEQVLTLTERWGRYKDADLWLVATGGTHPYVYPDILISTLSDVEELDRILRHSAI